LKATVAAGWGTCGSVELQTVGPKLGNGLPLTTDVKMLRLKFKKKR